MNAPDSVAGIIDLLAENGLLAGLGLTESHARVLKARGAIPWHWHQPIVETAEKHGLPITHALLARFATDKRKRKGTSMEAHAS